MKRLLKLLVISFAALFLLAGLLSALLPSQVLVSRAINITAPVDSLRALTQSIYRWREWIEGMNGPTVQIQSATKAQLGQTAVSITGVTDSTVVSYWEGKSGSPQIATIRLISSPGQPVTVVQWQFEQRLKWYPWEKIGSMMNDKILGTMMEKNLLNLKNLAEAQLGK